MPIIFEKKENRKLGIIYIACGNDLMFIYKRGTLGWNVRTCEQIGSDGFPAGTKELVIEGCSTRSAAIVQAEAALLSKAGYDYMQIEIEYQKGVYL